MLAPGRLQTTILGPQLAALSTRQFQLPGNAATQSTAPRRRFRKMCSSVLYEERLTGAALPRAAPEPPTSSTSASPEWESPSSSVDSKELSRRMKISAANRGRTPWNKGKNLSEQVREKIRQRTFEAMQRPEVRARMAEANQHRLPHREDVKERIRTVLRERVASAKEVIAQQAVLIVDDMRLSDDAVERGAAEHPEALDVIGRMAWRHLKRDFELLHAKWKANHNDFRSQLSARFLQLEERAQKRHRQGAARRAAKTAQGKVSRALAMQAKLKSAREKLAAAEATLKKVAPFKGALQANPTANSDALQKIMKIESLVATLRAQVGALTDAMAPLEQYLVPQGTKPSGEYALKMTKTADARVAAVGQKH